MRCPYGANAFCASLAPDLRARLCQACETRRCPSGSLIDATDFRETFAVLLDGFVVSTYADSADSKPISPMELLGDGHVLTTPRAWQTREPMPMTAFVICDSAVALFNHASIEVLDDTSLDFAWALFDALRRKQEETALALMTMGSKDARCAIAHVLAFCQRHRIGQLTHAQIALATGLARPTVTKAMGDLIKTEPDLFYAAEARA